MFVDTNILIRLTDQVDPLYSVVDAAVSKLLASGTVILMVPQTCYEFWTVATRPQAANGLGIQVPQCLHQLNVHKNTFQFRADPPGLYDEWERIVVVHNCHGRISFDARIAAAMNLLGETEILTINVADFQRFAGIVPIHPASVLP